MSALLAGYCGASNSTGRFCRATRNLRCAIPCSCYKPPLLSFLCLRAAFGCPLPRAERWLRFRGSNPDRSPLRAFSSIRPSGTRGPHYAHPSLPSPKRDYFLSSITFSILWSAEQHPAPWPAAWPTGLTHIHMMLARIHKTGCAWVCTVGGGEEGGIHNGRDGLWLLMTCCPLLGDRLLARGFGKVVAPMRAATKHRS